MMFEQPRTSDDAAARPSTETSAEAFQVTPRPAGSRARILKTRVVPIAASVALLATSGVFAVNLSTSHAAPALPAPVRADDAASRDNARTLAAEPEQAVEGAASEDAAAAGDAEAVDEAPVSDEAEEVTDLGDEAYVGVHWADVFGSSAGEKFAQSGLIVRSKADSGSTELNQLKEGDKVAITDKVVGKYRQVAVNGKIGYVLNDKLGDAAPAKEAEALAATEAPKTRSASTSNAAKPTAKAAPKQEAAAQKSAPAETYTGSTSYSGKSVLGLKPKAMVVYNAVTERWSFSSIGGYRASSRSNHQYGGAIDFMLTPGKDSAKGWAVANYVTANAAAFDIDHVIFEQKIWTPYKPYWRPMADRGSITQNHYDHVHVSVKL